MSTPDLPGLQERVWCGSSGGGASTTATTRPVADESESDICINANECEQKASELGFNQFQKGVYPTKVNDSVCSTKKTENLTISYLLSSY